MVSLRPKGPGQGSGRGEPSRLPRQRPRARAWLAAWGRLNARSGQVEPKSVWAVACLPARPGTLTLLAAPPPPSSDSPRALCGGGRSATFTLPRERPPAPSYGRAVGRQCSQLPSDFQKDSATPFVSSGLCLWEPLVPGAPVMSAHSHYLYVHCVRSGQALQCGANGSSPEHPLPSLPLGFPLLSTSAFQQLPVWHLSSVLALQAQSAIRGLFLVFVCVLVLG